MKKIRKQAQQRFLIFFNPSMYARTNKKLTIQSKYTPLTTFLSPVQKYNQRSFSASSLHSKPDCVTFPGSLRDQVRLQSFKKSVVNESRLNKTAINKATLKVQAEEASRYDDSRQQIRQLNQTIVRLREEIHQLNKQHSQDMMLISRQNELINQLEKELMIAPKENPCQCYMADQYVLTIKNLELKIRHLQQQKKEFKNEIRDLIVKQEELKYELSKSDQRQMKDATVNRKLQDMLYAQNKEEKVEEKAKRERRRERGQGQEQDITITRFWNSSQNSIKNIDLRKYFDELKNRRNKEIDQIENLLK